MMHIFKDYFGVNFASRRLGRWLLYIRWHVHCLVLRHRTSEIFLGPQTRFKEISAAPTWR